MSNHARSTFILLLLGRLFFSGPANRLEQAAIVGAGPQQHAQVAVPQAAGRILYFPVVYREFTRPEFPYRLQDGSPAYIANFANTAGCAWLGIAGQAFDLSGQAMTGLLVHLEGGGLNYDTVTGGNQAYGPGGYELYIDDHPIATTDTYHVQLRSSGGTPLSDVYAIPTFADCNKNLVLVNYVQIP